MKILKRLSYIVCAVIIMSSCSDDYLETTTETNVSDVKVTSSIQGLESIMNGVYRKLYQTYESSVSGQGIMALNWRYDLRCEDIAFNRNAGTFYMDYKLWYNGAPYSTTHQNWSFYYNIILNTNLILDNIENFSSNDLYNKVKGQALAMRAWSYFRLIRLYQHTYIGSEDKPGVILRLKANADPMPRASVKDVYTQIDTDLNDALTLLKDESRGRKSNINYAVAAGIKARVCLEKNEWGDAANYAKEARKGYSLMTTNDYKAGFNDTKNSEWIWGVGISADQTVSWHSLYTVITSNPLPDGSLLNYNDYNWFYGVNKDLYALMQDNDIRKDLFNPTDSRFNYIHNKFQIKENFTGDYPLMRASEMLLIEAEASYRNDQEGVAQGLLKELYTARAKDKSLVTDITLTGTDLLDEILLQRRIELWGEGFRFFDLKRTKAKMQRNEEQFLNHPSAGISAGRMYINPGEELWNMQIPKKEFEANSAIDPVEDQNPAGEKHVFQ